MIILLVFFKMIAQRKETISERIREIVMILLCLPGMIFILKAPGNSYRAAHLEKVEFLDIDNILDAFRYYMNAVVGNGFILILIATMVIIMLKQKQAITEILHKLRYYFVGAAGIIAMSITGFNTERPIYLGYLPMLIGILCILVYSIKLVAKGCVSPLEFIKRVFYIIDIYALVFILRQYPGNTSDFMTVVLITSSLILVGMLLGIFHWALRSEQILMQISKLKNNRIFEKIKSIPHKLDAVMSVACVCAAGAMVYNLVIYADNAERITEYQNRGIELWENLDFETAESEVLVLEHRSAFDTEHVKYFVVAWAIAQDEEIWERNKQIYLDYTDEHLFYGS